MNGGYMNHHHLFNATGWFNTGSLQEKSITSRNYDNYSYRLNYNTNLDNITLNSRLKLNSQFLAGLYTNKISIEQSDRNGKNKIKIDLLSLYRTNDHYLINIAENRLEPELYRRTKNKRINNRIDINIEHKYKYTHGNGKLNLAIKSSTLGSAYDYNILSFTAKNNNQLDKLKITTRAFLQIGSGSYWATESKLFLAGANTEEMMNSKFTRTHGFVPVDYLSYDYTTNHFHSGGGLNLRGYTGYLCPEFNTDGSIASFDYSGTSGASFNTEIDFSYYLPYSIRKNNIDAYLFADAGIITSNNLTKENYKNSFSELRADAGIGFTYTFDNFGPLEKVKPIIIRLDMPLFLNRAPADDDFIQLRWLIGINRAF